MISFVSFRQASQPTMNFNISELVYSLFTLSFLFIRIWSDKWIHALLYSLETYTRIKTKLGKTYTRFETKTALKLYPLGALHTYMANITEVYPASSLDLKITTWFLKSAWRVSYH